MATLGDIDAESLATMRSRAPVEAELSDAVTRTEFMVKENPNVTVRVHSPVDAIGPLPCVYSIHASRYILGDFQLDDTPFDGWCGAVGLVGVSVECRLAPETPYPGPIEDCYCGLLWAYQHAEELGIDGGRLGVHGISAGGGLAAALALLARDRGQVPLAFQLLDCPMLDDRQITFSSQLDGLCVWTKKTNAFAWRAYLGDLYGGADVPAYAAAARATDLAGLPPAYVSVGAIDGFHDEDVDYAVRPNHAIVATELHVYPGAPARPPAGSRLGRGPAGVPRQDRVAGAPAARETVSVLTRGGIR